MSDIKHDRQGFLVGDLVAGQRELLDQQQASVSIWRGIRSDVRAIARSMGLASRAAGGATGKAAEPAGRGAAAARSGAAGARSDARAAVPRARDAMGRFSAVQKTVVARRAAEDISAAPAAMVPTVEATRDARGRFSGGGADPRKPGKPGEGGGFGARLSERLGGLSDAIKGMATGADQVDPAITAMQEVKSVVEPLGRGFGRLFGRTQEQKKEHWYKRILKALSPKKDSGAAVSAAPGEVRSGSFLGTLAGGLLSKLTPLISGVGPMLLMLLKRVFMPIAALWGSFELGKFIGGKLYEWLDSSGITTKVFDAFDSISTTISDAWKSTTDGFVKAVDFLASIPKKVEGLFEAIDQGIRRIPVIGDIYGKAADAGKAVAADVKKGYREARTPVVLDVDGKKVAQDPGAAQSVSQSAGRMVGKVAKGAADAKDWALGTTSESFESGGKGAGTISTGRGDAGGASYGTYQLSSKRGTLDKFLQSSGYVEQFKGMKPGSREFNAQWQKIAREDPSFGKKQHGFIEDTHYKPQMEKLQQEGIDLTGRSAAVKDAVWSTSVQFGGKSSLISKALAGKDMKSMKDEDIINSIQDYKARNNDSLFSSSSKEVRASTLGRAESERVSLLSLAGKTTAQSNAIQTARSAAVPSPIPEKLPPAADVAMPTVAANDAPAPVRVSVKQPIGQDVGDRSIAHIVSGGISA